MAAEELLESLKPLEPVAVLAMRFALVPARACPAVIW
jgi:hypothetical protein